MYFVIFVRKLYEFIIRMVTNFMVRNNSVDEFTNRITFHCKLHLLMKVLHKIMEIT